MGLKNINFKQMALEKGEKIALWGSVAAMLVLVGLGFVYNGLLGNSASATTDELVGLKDKGERAFNGSRPGEGADKIDPALKKAGMLELVDPNTYPCENDFFIPLSLDDRKWRKPEVLLPAAEDFQLDLMKTQVRSFIFGGTRDKPAIMFLLEKTRKETKTNNLSSRGPVKVNTNVLKGGVRGGFPGGPGGPGMAPPGGPGGGPGGAMRPPGEGAGGQPGAAAMQPGATGSGERQEIASIMVPIDRLAKDDKMEGRPAETIYPCRMIVVQGAFPFKRQLELFRRSLRFESIEQMEKEAAFEFTGFNVQRRVTPPVGKPGDWKDIDVKNSVRPLLLFGIEPEDEKLKNYGLVWAKDRLVIPRPLLARDQKYPEPIIKSIQDTIAVIEKAASDSATPPLVQPRNKFDSSFDIFGEGGNEGGKAGAGNPMGNPMGVPMGKPMGENARTGGTASQERLVPEKCLIRFLDVTVQQGFTYEYRIQIEMANPLHGKSDKSISQELTKEKFLLSEWVAAPQKLTVPYETEYYAVEENRQKSLGMLVKPDQTWVQIHRWLDWTPVNPLDEKNSQTPVGDWSVAEQILVSRGEYIGRWDEAKVPVWAPKLDDFVFAQPPEVIKKKKIVQHKGIPVDFNTGALLVDFNGGKQTMPVKRDGKDLTLREEGSLEMLVLSPDGKLLVRNSRDDAQNKERQDRFKTWTDWIKAVESGGSGAKKKDDFFDKKEK